MKLIFSGVIFSAAMQRSPSFSRSSSSTMMRSSPRRFAGIRERLEGADVPKYFKGTAIAFVTGGLMSLAFMGFAGLDKFK